MSTATVLTITLLLAAACTTIGHSTAAYPQPCGTFKDVGLDFAQLTTLCTCLQIASLDSFTSSSSAPNNNKTVLIRVDVLCMDMRLISLRQVFLDAAKLPFFIQRIVDRLGVPNATKLLVYYNVTLRDVGASSLTGEGSWSYFAANIDMRKESNSTNATAAVEALTFDTCKDLFTETDPTLLHRNDLLFNNQTFSPLRKLSFVNLQEDSNKPFNIGQLGIDSPLPDTIEHVGRLPLLELEFRDMNISMISTTAFDRLQDVADSLSLTIVNAQIQQIPLAALSVFANISTFNMTNNKIQSVAAPPTDVKSVAAISGGTLDLSNNAIEALTADAFWNRMPNATTNSTDRLTRLSLDHNSISSIDGDAFHFLSAPTNSTTSGKNFFIDLSYNKISAIGAAFAQLPANYIDFDVSNNEIRRVEVSDLSMTMWSKLLPIRLANNQYNCTNSDDMAWLACWAQHTVGNLDKNIDYLKCATGNSTTLGSTTTDLVKKHFIPSGNCLRFFPNDKMFIWHDGGGGGGGRGPGYIHAWEVLMLLFVLAMAAAGCGVGYMLYTKRWTLNRFVRFHNEEERGNSAPTYGGIA